VEEAYNLIPDYR